MDLSFKRNIGKVDRIIRIAAGVILLYLAFFNPLMLENWAVLLMGIFGTAMIIEGTIGY
ncbi:MAG: DUF2892 domain-containing protein [Syntrophomonadaceae bacterium]|jgi:hypothetical protein|nr:DUF2892 domain-containing protein [Syntrophomonadaceae bacterium]